MDKFKKWCKAFCWVLIVMGLLINVFGFCIIARELPSPAKLDFDYNGVIVGILSLLVTVLIGWNVYSLIDLKAHSEQSGRLKSELKKLKKESNEGVADIEKNLALIIQNGSIAQENSLATYESLRHWIRYITIEAKIGNYNSCYKAIEEIKRLYSRNDTIHPYDKAVLNSLIENIINKKNIRNLKILSMIVNNLDELTPLMNELHHAAFEVLLLHPGSTRDIWVQTLIEQYPAEVADALGTDKETTRELLNKMWGDTYTDTAGNTRTYAEWAALLATEEDITEYYKTIPK